MNRKEREQLFLKTKSQIQNQTKEKISVLYHHIHSMKLGDEYIFKNETELQGIIQFLNTVD